VSGGTDLVVVASPPDGVGGSILASALESAGIPATVRGDAHSGWLFPGAGGGFGPVQVLVPREFLAEATAILAELDAGD
jgi:hypothetical protein